MFTLVYKNKTIECSYDKNNIHIENSSAVRTEADMKAILNIIIKRAARRDITYKRAMSSWIREWKAHNLLSDYDYQTARTSSVDLNENESFFRRAGYFFLALFYKG